MTDHFVDRRDAGRRLAAALPVFQSEKTLVVALPRGGVPVAAEISAARALSLDILLVRKIGAPLQPELALGAIAEGDPPIIVFNTAVMDEMGLSEAEVRRLAEPESAEIAVRQIRYRGGRPMTDIARKTVVLVDDGAATGATARAALDALRAKGAGEIVLALPVAPATELARLSRAADQTVCLATPNPFRSVGTHYDRFPPVSDDEVVTTLRR